jgi:hypothetical protein
MATSILLLDFVYASLCACFLLAKASAECASQRLHCAGTLVGVIEDRTQVTVEPVFQTPLGRYWRSCLSLGRGPWQCQVKSSGRCARLRLREIVGFMQRG